MLKKFIVPFALLISCSFLMGPAAPTAKGDVIELDLAAVTPALRGAFIRAERVWESRLTGYSNNLPNSIKSQLTGRLIISAQTVPIDGVGGILGAAGPTALAISQESIGTRSSPFLVRQYAIPTTSLMQFDVADANRADFFDTVLHEMGHALGIGSVWELNGVIDTVAGDASPHRGLLSLRNGEYHYTGSNGLRGFREESGHIRANYVPVENGFGPGTALGHWKDDNWFFNPRNGSRTELMTPFATTSPVFISEATWGSLADIGYAVEGYNNGFLPRDSARPFFPKRGFGSQQFNRVSAIPEPSSIAVISLMLTGLLARRRRSI